MLNAVFMYRIYSSEQVINFPSVICHKVKQAIEYISLKRCVRNTTMLFCLQENIAYLQYYIRVLGLNKNSVLFPGLSNVLYASSEWQPLFDTSHNCRIRAYIHIWNKPTNTWRRTVYVLPATVQCPKLNSDILDGADFNFIQRREKGKRKCVIF